MRPWHSEDAAIATVAVIAAVAVIAVIAAVAAVMAIAVIVDHGAAGRAMDLPAGV